MLISTDLIIQAIFISAIFLFAISTPKMLYYVSYLHYSISQIKNRGDIARRSYKEGKLTKEELEEFLEYNQRTEGRKQQFKEEMEAWEKFKKSLHEPFIETLTSLVLVIAIVLIPENVVYDQSSSFLLALGLIETFTLGALSIWLRKMSASYDTHFREVADLIQKERKRKIANSRARHVNIRKLATEKNSKKS